MHRIIRGSLLLLLLGALAWPAAAQQVRTLAIQNGKVYIDGQPVAPEALPASLEPAHLEASFSFVGEARPVIELNNRLYRLDGNRLTELGALASGDHRVSVFFRSEGRASLPAGRVGAAPFEGELALFPGADWSRPASFGYFTGGESVTARQMGLLMRQAQELEKLSGTIRQQRALRNPAQLAEQVSRRAAEITQAAHALPQLELQDYLHDVQRADGELYERLLRERRLEMETLALAGQIRTLQAGPARRQQVSLLRDKLEEVFAVKQENRRREIAQLELQLNELQRRVEERERLHDHLIEQRIEELLGQREAHDW